MTNIQNTPPAPSAPYTPPGAQQPVQQGNSGTAIAGLVLGILAIVISWVPIINNFAFFIGLVGLVLAIIGVVSTVKKKKSGKGIALTALILNVLSLIFVLITQSFYSSVVDSVDEAINGSSATVTSNEQADGQEDNSAQEEAASEENTYDLAVGTTIEVNDGLSVTVDSVETLTNYDDTPVLGVQVTYVNNSSESQSYNSWDREGEDANGARESETFYISYNDDDEGLSSGTLAVGGSKSGYLYFEADTEKILYSSSLFSDEPTASWLVE